MTPNQANSKPVPLPLIEGVHYYIENGRWVFTQTYHTQRGYCCGSGCRHCPWKHVPEHERPRLKA
jgi:Family of unknown function (DUF5522)